ncbi:MAG: hypothetical protein NT150_06035 [Bacteroidetes bacterium]|nr:hypothetical protein [Bacteroidota bacterium]
MDFTEAMAKNSNEQLLKIVTDLRNDYQPAAIIAAEKEIEKRNLSDLQIQRTKANLDEQKRIENLYAKEELSVFLKVIVFVFPLSALMFKILFYYDWKKQGKTLKAEQLKNFSLYGVAFYVIITLLSNLF